MATPFLDFVNCVVRITGEKKYQPDPNGFISKSPQDSEDYTDILLFLEEGSSRNPTKPSSLDSFTEIQLGVNVLPLKGYFCDPERRPMEIKNNIDYYAIYNPNIFDLESTPNYCQIRFLDSPPDSVNADFFTGDKVEVLLITRNARNDLSLYPEMP